MTPICTPLSFELIRVAASSSSAGSPVAIGRAASAIRPKSRLVYCMLFPFRGYSLISQPLRNMGFTHLLASLLLVNSILAASHISLPSKWTAIAPSTTHSAYGPATLKLEQAGAPPLQARSQSRQCAAWLSPVLAPGERVR